MLKSVQDTARDESELIQLQQAAEKAWLGSGVQVRHLTGRMRTQVQDMIKNGCAPIEGGAIQTIQVQDPPEGARPSIPGIVPFTSGAHEYNEPFVDESVQPGAAATNLQSPHPVPAQGYVRHLWILVQASGGVLGPGVLSADYPWNLFQQLALTDVNGAPLYGFLNGYDGLWTNIAGGYAGGVNDPRAHPIYVGTINGVFAMRIPVEISHKDAFGCLANQNAAAAYQLHYTINPSATLFSTAPTTVPTFRIRAWLEAWTLPNDLDVLGRPQAQVPPRHGTSQYTSGNSRDVFVGENNVLLVRVGNLIRYLLVIARDNTGARSDGCFPDPLRFQWDARYLRNIPQAYITSVLMREKIPDLVARDTGVFLLPNNTSNRNTLGDDDPTLWYPTVQASRMQLDGNVATAGTMKIITNDVAPVEVAPEERFVETSRTGYTPPIGVAAEGVQ